MAFASVRQAASARFRHLVARRDDDGAGDISSVAGEQPVRVVRRDLGQMGDRLPQQVQQSVDLLDGVTGLDRAEIAGIRTGDGHR